jgi:transposase
MRRSAAEKRQIVEETMQPEASVARVARAHGVNANQVFHWRRQYRQGLLEEKGAEAVKLLPVHVTEGLLSRANRSGRAAGDHRTTEAAGTIQVEVSKGKVRITGRVDSEALRTVLEKLLG